MQFLPRNQNDDALRRLAEDFPALIVDTRSSEDAHKVCGI
jgi:hypothetical protein